MVRATSGPTRARACDLCPTLWEGLGSLDGSPLPLKRQRLGCRWFSPPMRGVERVGGREAPLHGDQS